MTDSAAAADLSTSPDSSAGLTPEQATELLGKMVNEHRAREADPFKLTPEASAEKLAELAKTAAAVQDPESGNTLSPMHTLEATAMLDEIGIPAGGIRRILEGQKFEASDVEWARAAKREMVGDADFVKRYLAGDAVARHRMTAIDAILAAGAEGKA